MEASVRFPEYQRTIYISRTRLVAKRLSRVRLSDSVNSLFHGCAKPALKLGLLLFADSSRLHGLSTVLLPTKYNPLLQQQPGLPRCGSCRSSCMPLGPSSHHQPQDVIWFLHAYFAYSPPDAVKSLLIWLASASSIWCGVFFAYIRRNKSQKPCTTKWKKRFFVLKECSLFCVTKTCTEASKNKWKFEFLYWLKIAYFYALRAWIANFGACSVVYVRTSIACVNLGIFFRLSISFRH